MRKHLPELSLTLNASAPPSVYRGKDGLPSIEVHSVRVARRRGPRGVARTDLVVEICQRRRGYLDPEVQKAVDNGTRSVQASRSDFRFRRGCTLIIDPIKEEIRYVIATKGDVTDNDELERVRQFLAGETERQDNAFYGGPTGIDPEQEVFAALHRRQESASDF
jgi:hypothetical protein